MNNLLKNNVICWVTFLAFGACSNTHKTQIVVRNNHTIEIRSDILCQRLVLNESGIHSVLLIRGDTAKTPVNEFSFVVWKAFPDEHPRGLTRMETSVEQLETVRNQTDALELSLNNLITSPEVKWTDSVMVSSRKTGSFRIVEHRINKAENEKIQLTLIGKLSETPYAEDVVFEIVYEVFKDYPAIRKRMVIRNEGAHWLKIDHLTMAHIETDRLFPDVIHLTPPVRDIDPSIIAFANADASRGLIVASEVPSKLRKLADDGQVAYDPDYFEWVLGPGETFESEPFFVYAFDGETFVTASALSTARDRCVEGGFRRFLKQHILMPADTAKTVAPLFCSWTNYSASIDENNMREAAEIASYIGFKCFQLDAGWSDAGPSGGWAVSSVHPDLKKFKDLKAFMAELKKKGMKPGLWYSVFNNESDVLKQNDDPSLYSIPLVKRSGGLGLSFAFDKSRNLFVDDIICLNRAYEAVYFKQDLSNICYGDMAEGHESRTLKESYLRGLRGLFATQDRIHAVAPDIFLQLSHEIYWLTPGPAGDIAVLQHADAYHIAPNEYWGAGMRSQRVDAAWNMDKDSLSHKLIEGCFRARDFWYMHRGLPPERLEVFGAATTNYEGSLTVDIQDRQVCSWLVGVPSSFSGDLGSLTADNIERYRDRFAIIKELQQRYDIYSHYQFSGVPPPTDDDWHWWGKLNDEGCGAVVVLRGFGGLDVRKINIPWILPNKKYSVKGLLSGRIFGDFTGKQLQEGALELSLNCFSQEIIEITKK